MIKRRQAEDDLRKSIEMTIADTGYFIGQRDIPNVSMNVRGLQEPDLKKLQMLAELAQQMVTAMQGCRLQDDAGSGAGSLQKVRRDASTSSVYVFPQFDALADKINSATRLEADLTAFDVGAEDYERLAFGMLQQKSRFHRRNTLVDYVPTGVKMKAALDQLAHRRACGRSHQAVERGAWRKIQACATLDMVRRRHWKKSSRQRMRRRRKRSSRPQSRS